MRICLIGEYSGNLDEGMRNVTSCLYKELSKKHNVLPLDTKKISLSWLGEIREFKPEIIHYVHGPSIISLLVMRILARASHNDVKTVMSATQPRFSFFSRRFIPLLKPNLILTQSYNTNGMFKDLGCGTQFLPNGVDIYKFMPIAETIKEQLREKYEVDKGKFVVLHIGPIRKKRNIQIFSKIQKIENVQVVFVGSTSMPMEKDIYKSLKERGCMIWRSYFPNIEEIYQLSDCYVFPSMEALSSIEMPLSVLEAMACNLPVITTRFGALTRVFDGGNGLFFIKNEEDIFTALEEIKHGIKIKTREKVLPYSWKNVVRRLEGIYEELIENKG